MPRFIISILFVFTLASCSLSTTKNLIEHKELEKKEVFNRYFSKTKDFVYKAKIKAFGNNVGGILIIKKIKEDNFRIVFTSEFGNKFFDFEIINDEYRTHFILDALNRKALIKLLQNDFLTMVKEKNKVISSFTGANEVVYKVPMKSRYNYFFIDRKTRILEKIVHASKYKEKTVFQFKKEGKEIKIEHKKFPVSISLQAFNL